MSRAKGKAYDPEACIYCGDPATTKDHVPPKKWLKLFATHRKFCTENKVIVPSCGNCNGILGGHPLFTIEERRAYVRTYLWRKFARLLMSPGWKESELEELGPSLRTYIKAQQSRKAHIQRRIGMARW